MFDYPALRIEQISSQFEYEVSDPGGQSLGRTTQVSGPKPRKGPLAMFGAGVGDARVVLQLFAADGTPAFFVDYQRGAPVAFVAPDGTVIGRYAEDRTSAAQQMAGQGALRRMMAAMAPAMCNVLLDGADRPLCRLNWEMRLDSTQNDNRQWHVVGCSYTDMNGVQVAKLDVNEGFYKGKYDLQFFYQLPEPMRTLILASPIAFDLTRS
ncbi:hypothetical protein [Actinomadura latina]|uniref:Uncharacterized protein n=1 Tax=Actinomadura latina TaxID=163603 RepID=A0A846YVC2_9ACTN|nr:hypothetical protein [Actinomadura latina]NKZ02448.1 hypothetical protein [Actinomadura latina]